MGVTLPKSILRESIHPSVLWLLQELCDRALHWERKLCCKTRQCCLLCLQHTDPGTRNLTNSMCASLFFRNHKDTCLIFRNFFFFFSIRDILDSSRQTPPILQCLLLLPKRSTTRKQIYQNIYLVHWINVPKHWPHKIWLSWLSIAWVFS